MTNGKGKYKKTGKEEIRMQRTGCLCSIQTCNILKTFELQFDRNQADPSVYKPVKAVHQEGACQDAQDTTGVAVGWQLSIENN